MQGATISDGFVELEPVELTMKNHSALGIETISCSSETEREREKKEYIFYCSYLLKCCFHF
jgi:hypothetical protein